MFALEPTQSPARPSPRELPAGGKQRWRLRSARRPGALAHLGLPSLVATILELRGVTSGAEAQLFLGGREVPKRDPYELSGLKVAIQRLRSAIRITTP